KMFSSNNQDIYFGTSDGQLLSFDGKNIRINSEKGSKKIETLYKWEKYPIIFSDNSGFCVTDINSNRSKVYINGSLKSILPISENKLIAAFNSGVSFINYDRTSNNLPSEKILINCRAYNLCLEEGTNNIYAS